MEDCEVSVDLYIYGVVDVITDYLTNHAKVEYQVCCSNFPDESGGVCGIAFVENGFPHLVMFDYWYI